MDAIVVLAPTNYPKRNTRRSSTKLPKPSPASELQQFFDFPDVIGNACFHCRRDAKRFMHAAKVIVHEVQSDHVSVVFQLLAESVREPVDWSRKDLSQYAGIARQNGGDVRQESGPVNALFTDKQVAYFSSVASLTIRAAAWLASSSNGSRVSQGMSSIGWPSSCCLELLNDWIAAVCPPWEIASTLNIPRL
jgi:hypothetical protein